MSSLNPGIGDKDGWNPLARIGIRWLFEGIKLPLVVLETLPEPPKLETMPERDNARLHVWQIRPVRPPVRQR